jgi:predicted dienelactone hydrolase
MEFPYSLKEITHTFQYQLNPNEAKFLTLKLWIPLKKENSVSSQIKLLHSYPLILFSHGYLGAASQSLFLTHFLTKNGYIVAAPEHTDGLFYNPYQPIKFFNVKKPISAFAEERLKDMKAALDELLELNQNPRSELFGLISENAIGTAGHSLGGWTAVGISGGSQNYSDHRIKAGLFLAPFIKDYTPNDFKRIHIPQMHMVGEMDQDNLKSFLRFILREKKLPRKTAYDQTNPPKFFLMIKNGNHFTFTDWTCLFYRNLSTCQMKNPKAQTILGYSLLFFDTFLKQKDKARQGLLQNNANLLHYEYEL